MITAEVLYERLKQLDGNDLEIVNEYIDLMLAHPSNFQQLIAAKYRYFPETQFTSATEKPAYTTRALSIDDMNDAVDYEAGLRK